MNIKKQSFLNFHFGKLKNKVAIVTGAAKGIGESIALRLAEEGANVVVSDVDLKGCSLVCKNIEKKYKVRTLAVKCDVSNKNDVQNMVKETMKKFKKLDILVNNAGIFPFKSFLEMEEKDWDRVLDVNLKSVFLCSREAAKVMKPGSKIVSISSIASLIGYPGLTHYCASKAGINGLTRAMALELAPKKINVNVIAPGAIVTPGLKAALDEKTAKQMTATIPLKRMGFPKDIANAVAFLVSDDADYVTGHVLVVDGGWTIQ